MLSANLEKMTVTCLYLRTSYTSFVKQTQMFLPFQISALLTTARVLVRICAILF